MVDVFFHIVTVIGLLCLVGGNCFALGWPLLAGTPQGQLPDKAGRWFLALTTGLGCYICILVALGLLGQLNFVSITGVFAVTLVAHLIGRRTIRRLGPTGSPTAQLREAAAWIVRHLRLLGVIAGVAVPLLIWAIAFQLWWDEYAYHLPQAFLIAEGGRLAIDPLIMQPLHPHSYHVLYAAALIVGDEALTDAIHAASGLLVVLGLYFVGRRLVGATTSLFASVLFLLFVLDLGDMIFPAAYVDLGTSLFSTAAYYCLVCAFSDVRQSTRWIVLGAFLLGISVSVKMQAIIAVPAFVVIAALHPAKHRAKVGAVFVFAAVGGFWYLRNYLVSGDPFHPLGGSVFGYWSWNASDLEHLGNVIAGKRGAPPLLAFLALAAPITFRSGPTYLKGMWFVSCLGGGVWAMSSLYDRYLLSVFPVIALTSAVVLQHAVKEVANSMLPRQIRARAFCVCRKAAHIGCAILLLAFGALRATIDLPRVCATADCRDELFGRELLSYGVMQDVKGDDWLKVYQVGLERELWFMTVDTVGGDYGPARNSDLLRLGSDGHAVKAHLASLGRNALLVAKATAVPFQATESFLGHFELYKEDSRVALYVTREALAAGDDRGE